MCTLPRFRPPCRPTELQLRVYSAVLGSSSVRKMLNTTGADFGDQVGAGLLGLLDPGVWAFAVLPCRVAGSFR
jgi:hypothetical protein